jgi:hypothetical protein
MQYGTYMNKGKRVFIPNEDPNHFVLLSSRPLSSVIKYGDYVRYLHFPLDFLRWSLTSGFPSADIPAILDERKLYKELDVNFIGLK